MPQGCFITFEGVDGCGKSTQCQRLAEALKEAYPNREILLTRNPGGSPFGQAIRQLILTPRPEGEAPVSPMAELMLYMADRAQHVDEVLRPALAAGAMVLCDRFVDSSVAYQGAARGLAPELILKLNEMACAGLQPDLTLLFDAPVEALAQRRKARGTTDRLEQEGLSFQAKVRAGFQTLAQAHSTRIQSFNALQSVESLHQEVWALVEKRLPQHG